MGSTRVSEDPPKEESVESLELGGAAFRECERDGRSF